MSHFILQPCHLRESKFTPLKGQTCCTLNWAELVTKLAPSKEYNALMNLRSVQPGAYIGLATDKSNAKKVRNFLLLNQDRSAKLEWVLKKDPGFESRIVEVYRVDEVHWDSEVKEFDTPGLPPWEQP